MKRARCLLQLDRPSCALRALWLAVPLLFGPACGQQQVDACADRRAADLPCVDVQLTWPDVATQAQQDQQIDQITLLVSGDWVGYAQSSAATPYRLPAAAAVVLPPYFPGAGKATGAVRIEVEARLGASLRGRGVLPVTGLRAQEHREVSLALTPATP